MEPGLRTTGPECQVTVLPIDRVLCSRPECALPPKWIIVMRKQSTGFFFFFFFVQKDRVQNLVWSLIS